MIGNGEVVDVLFLLVNAREGIVDGSFLFITQPPEIVAGDKSASADIDTALGRTLVKASSGSLANETIIASTDTADIINTIIGFGLPGLSDPALVADLLEVRIILVLEGSQVYEFQQTAFEKLDGFKGKKINDILISDIPSILSEMEFIQSKLVEDSRFLARTLLDNIDCSSLAAGTSARTECDLGEDFFAQGQNTGLPGAERIDFYNKAWLQGVKVLLELGVPGDIARRF